MKNVKSTLPISFEANHTYGYKLEIA